MRIIKKYLQASKRVRVWIWKNGSWLGAKLQRLSGPIAGLMFLLLIPLGLSLLQIWTNISIPIIPPGTKTTVRLFLGVLVIFGIFVVLETVANILKWVFGLRLRIYDWMNSNNDE